MTVEPNLTVNVHIYDGTVFRADRIESSGGDWVSLAIGGKTSLFLKNADQAKALIDAAEDAFFTLRQIEDDKARAERARSRENYSYPVIREADPELERLLAEEEEIERRTRYNDESCSISNPCSDCLADEARMDEYEPF